MKEVGGEFCVLGHDLWRANLSADVFEKPRSGDQGQMLYKYLLLCIASLTAVSLVCRLRKGYCVLDHFMLQVLYMILH